MPLDWLYFNIPDDIHEVWVGFDYRKFAQDRSLRASADYVFSVEDFKAIAAR